MRRVAAITAGVAVTLWVGLQTATVAGYRHAWVVCGHWIADRAIDFWNISPDSKISLLQVILIAIGGYWAYHLYRVRREWAPVAKIEAGVLFRPDPTSNTAILFIRVKIANAAKRQVEGIEATATLLDAAGRSPKGDILLRAFDMKDPLIYAVGWMQIKTGSVVFAPVVGGLEPADCVETEVAFPLQTATPGLLAVRVTVTGTIGGRIDSGVLWGTFFYLDPSILKQDAYDPISISRAG